MQPVAPRSFPALCLDKTTLLLPKLSPLWNSLPQLASYRGIAERLLGLLTSSAVRKGSLENMQFQRCRIDMLCAIDRRVRADKPVQLTLMAFPFKVPNPAKVGPRRMPDLAELAALVQLYKLHLKTQSIYPPGLEIHIIHDGSYIADLFGVPLEEVRSYESYFARLVRALGANEFLYHYDFRDLLDAWVSDTQQAAHLREATLDWRRSSRDRPEWADWFSKTLGMINLRGLPMEEACRLLDQASNGQLPSEYRDVERSVHLAMLRYYAFDSLLHDCDPRPAWFPDAIHITTQCRPHRLAIWLVKRGQSLLPWHGVGVVNHSGKWTVALARDVLGNPSYEPVFLEGEDTPFFYGQSD